jgi:hypothetical protein
VPEVSSDRVIPSLEYGKPGDVPLLSPLPVHASQPEKLRVLGLGVSLSSHFSLKSVFGL